MTFPIVPKQKIIETYEAVYSLHPNDVKRFADVHKRTGANMDCITETIAEYQDQREAA